MNLIDFRPDIYSELMHKELKAFNMLRIYAELNSYTE